MLFDRMSQQFEKYEDNDVPIVIIAIDEKTTERLGKVETWSRQVSANLVNKLNSKEEKPVIIGIDLPYEGDKDKAGDDAFASACELGENVCLLVEQNHTGVILPYVKLMDKVKIGICNNMEMGKGGVVREFLPKIDTDGEIIDTFPVILYKAYQDHAGKSYHLKDMGNLPVSFNYSRNDSDYRTYSFIDVLYGNIDLDVFANKIVIVGNYIKEDRHHVPNIRGGRMTDAGLQANIVEALLGRKIVYKLPSDVLAGLYGILIFGCYCFVFLLKRKRSIPISLTVLALHFQFAYFLRNQYYIPIFPLWIFCIIAIMLGAIIGVYREKENISHLQKALETYVEADIVDEIVHNATFDIKLGGEKKEIAVLFVDIRGFTSLSEVLPPEQMVSILNEYLEMVAHAVIANGGSIDKFIGDAAMAVFNATKELDDYVLKAVYTAWDILKGASKLKEDCMEKYGKEVSFGIGIQCGPAIVGNIGCECRMDYTAIGDTVNTASRLESNAKAGQILISKEVYEEVSKYVKVIPIGKLTLKGKAQEIETYQVTGIIRKESCR